MYIAYDVVVLTSSNQVVTKYVVRTCTDTL
jgi:hypothetical protein